MKKKFIILFLSIIACVCAIVGVSACGGGGESDHVHSLTAYEATEATCQKAGNTAYWYCAGCGKYFADAEGTDEITLASTIVAKTSHTLTKTEAVAATCESAGNIEYYHCSVCDKYFSDSKGSTEVALADTVTTALGHDYAATFTWTADYSGATVALTCKNDGTHTVAAAAATVSSETDAATCEKAGKTVYTATYVYDGETYTDEQTVELAALEHDYGEVEIVWTEGSDGTYTAIARKVCANDSTHILTHAVELTKTDTSTCTTDGTITYVARSVWDHVLYEDTKVINVTASGHTYSTSWSYEAANPAHHWHVCTVCGAINDEHTDCTSSVVEATITSAGYEIYTCNVSGCDYNYNVATDMLDVQLGDNKVSLSAPYSYTRYYKDSYYSEALSVQIINNVLYYENASGIYVTEDKLVQGTDYVTVGSSKYSVSSEPVTLYYTAAATGTYTFTVTDSGNNATIWLRDSDTYESLAFIGNSSEYEGKKVYYGSCAYYAATCSIELNEGQELYIQLGLYSSGSYDGYTYNYTINIAYSATAIAGETEAKPIEVTELTAAPVSYSRSLKVGEKLYFSFTSAASVSTTLTVSGSVNLYVGGVQVTLTNNSYTFTVTSTATIVYLENAGSATTTAELTYNKEMPSFTENGATITLSASDLTGDGAYIKFVPTAAGYYTIKLDSTAMANVRVYNENGNFIMGSNPYKSNTFNDEYTAEVGASGMVLIIKYNGTLSADFDLVIAAEAATAGSEDIPVNVTLTDYDTDSDGNLIFNDYTGGEVVLAAGSSYYYYFSSISGRGEYTTTITVTAASGSLSGVTLMIGTNEYTVGANGKLTATYAPTSAVTVIVKNGGSASLTFVLTAATAEADDTSGEGSGSGDEESGTQNDTVLELGANSIVITSSYTAYFTAPADGTYKFTVSNYTDPYIVISASTLTNDVYLHSEGYSYSITLAAGTVVSVLLDSYSSTDAYTLTISTTATILEVGDVSVTITASNANSWMSGKTDVFTADASGYYTFSLAEDAGGYVALVADSGTSFSSNLVIEDGESQTVYIAAGDSVTLYLSSDDETAKTYTLGVTYSSTNS